MLRETGNTDAIIVEYGFLDSKLDDEKKKKNKWSDYAEAVVKSVAEYLSLPYDNVDAGDSGANYYKVVSGDTIFMGNNEYIFQKRQYFFKFYLFLNY